MKIKVIFSCEHATPYIPECYQYLFKETNSILLTHRGWDIGARFMFDAFCDTFKANGFAADVSRLLIDTNRSIYNKSLFSEWTDSLSTLEKERIIADYYQPYRERITECIRHFISQGYSVLHFSIHTFTPQLDGVKRNNDVGLLYDPGRPLEKKISQHIKKNLCEQNQHTTVRFNYPYKGIEDGLTRTLRRTFLPSFYLGIEIESNQSHFTTDGKPQSKLPQDFMRAMQHTLDWILS